MDELKHYTADFPVDFAILLPPQSRMLLPVESAEAMQTKIIPFCEHLKGKVVSQFVDIEKHVGHFLARAIAGTGCVLPPNEMMEAIISPLSLDKKIQILRVVDAKLDPGRRLPTDFFARLAAAKRIRNHFAHGAIVFVPKDNALVAVFNHDQSIHINEDFSKATYLGNYQIIEELNAYYQANFPVFGVAVAPANQNSESGNADA